MEKEVFNFYLSLTEKEYNVLSRALVYYYNRCCRLFDALADCVDDDYTCYIACVADKVGVNLHED